MMEKAENSYASQVNSQLNTCRCCIDDIDHQVIALLAQRFAVTKLVGELKAEHHLDAFDPDRERAQEEDMLHVAEEYGLNPSIALAYVKMVREKAKEQERSEGAR